jgi:hypothetical protein
MKKTLTKSGTEEHILNLAIIVPNGKKIKSISSKTGNKTKMSIFATFI